MHLERIYYPVYCAFLQNIMFPPYFPLKHAVFHMFFLVLFYVNTPIIYWQKLLFVIFFKHFGTLEGSHLYALFLSPLFNVCMVTAHKHFGNFFASPD